MQRDNSFPIPLIANWHHYFWVYTLVVKKYFWNWDFPIIYQVKL